MKPLNDDGEILAITETPMATQAGTPEGVKQQLRHMLEDAEAYGLFDQRGESIPFERSRKKLAKKKRLANR